MIQSDFTIYYSEEASLDLLEAVKWYNKINKVLGKKLKKDVKDLEKKIMYNPAFASIKYRNVRTVACKVFPFSIHYEVDFDLRLVYIVSLFHFSKEPFW